ncbi:MAG: hypothetical protein LBU11_00690 [Zoogloeaceae bacterium]|jgi:hypothetical protein|nr:hypothetical protein [Zoogloeaceae bacterium]
MTAKKTSPSHSCSRLSLDAPRWSELTHAYGSAKDIPPLLAQLKSIPECKGDEEPWFSLWSALAHQGDVYTASFAVVPFVIEVLASNPAQASYVYFDFPAWVEICRQKNSTEIPEDLADAYFSSLARLPHLVSEASNRPWDHVFLRCALSAIAVAKGHPAIAEAITELSTEVAADFVQWFHER